MYYFSNLIKVTLVALLLSACGSPNAENTSSNSARNATSSNNAAPKISVQLWSIKDEIKSDFKGTLKKIADMGFDGVEFAGNFGPYANDPKGLKAYLDSLGLEVSGAHVKLSLLNDQNFDSTVAFYKALDCKILIEPMDRRANDPAQVSFLINELNKQAKKLSAHEMQIGYHNHHQEFEAFKSETYWDYIAQKTSDNVVLQLDVGWVHYANHNPIDYIKKYPNRTITTHYKAKLAQGVKATQTTYPIIGQDRIDWMNLIKANQAYGGTLWFVVEQEEYPNGMTPLEAVKASKAGLDQYFNTLNSSNE